MNRLSSSCIYTLRHSASLREESEAGGSHKLTEPNKPWRTGSQLWAEAQKAGDQMAIVFAGADGTEPGLIYWAIIEDITINEESQSTTCRYTSLHPVQPPQPLSALRLLKSGKQLPDSDIRPYRICQTPGFLAELTE